MLAQDGLVAQLDKAGLASQIQLNKSQVEQIKKKNLTAALAWHGASPWVSAVNRGATETFNQYGVKVLVTTDAQYDPVKQVADIENIQALKPDLLLSLVIDGVSAREAYRAIVDAQTKLVLLSNPIPGFVHGRDFAGIVTDDMRGMGQTAAKQANAYLQGKGKIGMIYHDANYFITNTRDQAFLKAMSAFPGIEMTVKRGFVKEHDTSAIASAMMLRNPDLDLLYVSWDTAAEGVVEALRSDGHNSVKVISHDLGVNNLLDMAQQGNMLASVADRPFEIGVTMAKVALLAEVGESSPLFTLVPFDVVTKENIANSWQQAYRSQLPRIVQLAIGE
ncbi:hypothetical protein GCM10011357_32260 [Lacimicrobium alkaliphilum]|uniref:Periplasmic binding protein domain-containing protein n=1 Tax=Lacimicrobium alkaliphilum TaxID=1526571 RepID=A0ABQ1RQG1_9ALTE|nr:hypothetical protein GCM10011357_32260 [Lacimicrobium alkaliphilum]